MYFIRNILDFPKRHMYNYVLFSILISFFIFISCCAKSEKNRYVYIIGGAHEGERIYKFKTQDIYSSHAWELFAIEANPYVIKKIPKAPDTVILNKAIWIKDGIIKFYFSPQSDNRSSVYEDKDSQKGAVPIFITSIDFGQWLKNNFTINDHIVVSLDIEGAEYKVLNKMIIDNTIKYIDVLLVEFHPGIGGISENDIKELLKKIKKINILVERMEM